MLARIDGCDQHVRCPLGGRAKGGTLAVDILIAEDEPSILESLDFILRRAGWSIAAVTDGDAVLSTLRLVGTSASVATAGEAVLAAIAVNALLRLALAIVAGPVRFWLPLAVATIVAGGLGASTFLFLPRF